MFSYLRGAQDVSLNREIIILLLSSLVSLILFLMCVPLVFPDAPTYLAFSNQIIHLSGPTLSYRTFGYPLILIIGLYPFTGSLIGTVILQYLMAAVLPCIFYRILAISSEKIAFYASLLMIISLAPYNYASLIYPDQTQLFLLACFAYAVITFRLHPTRKSAFFSLFTYGCISAFRPTFSIILLVYIFVLYTLRKDRNFTRDVAPKKRTLN